MPSKPPKTIRRRKPAVPKQQVVPDPNSPEDVGRRFIRLGELLTQDSKLRDISDAALACGLEIRFTLRK